VSGRRADRAVSPSEIGRSRLHDMRFTISVSPAHLRGGHDVLATEYVRDRIRALAHRIHDINFTHHLWPFLRDAHGVYVTEDENRGHLRQLLALQEATGVTVTPVFNNVHTPNTAAALTRFADGLAPLVDAGLRSITVPHVLWVKMGVLQKRFPRLSLKDTVLRRVRTAQDFWNHAEAGYHVVNLDRTLVRDRPELKAVREAQDAFERRCGRRVLTALLDGEGCLGACALWEEHYQHTLTHERTDEAGSESHAVFRYPQEFSCMAIGIPGDNVWMNVGLPPFREDREEVCGLFDVVKLAGRGSFYSLDDCLTRIETFERADGPLVAGAPEPLRAVIGQPALAPLVARWRSAARTCRFQCWRCGICAELLVRAGQGGHGG